jgi:O-succinylbenzoic acid--CoA ligase
MSDIAFHKISCGGQPNWWPELLRSTQELIAGSASLLLTSPEVSDVTNKVVEPLIGLSNSPTAEASLFILTSGSTGSPKVVVLDRESLLTANQIANQRLGFAPRWICALSPDHIGGFLPVFRSLANGHDPLLALTNEARFDVDSLLSLARNENQLVPVALSLVWRQVNRLGRSRELQELANLAAVLVGGGPANEADAAAAETANLRLITTYGMTETCGGVVWNGRPLSGVNVEIELRAAEPITQSGEIGVICISGPTVATGYLVDSKLQRFSNAKFVTSDLGSLDSNGELRVHGRKDDMAIINGYNVSLPAVSSALKDLPGVNDAIALARPEPDGDQLVAYIATESENPPDLQVVRAFLARALGRGALPARVEIVRELPRTRNHKIDLGSLK